MNNLLFTTKKPLEEIVVNMMRQGMLDCESILRHPSVKKEDIKKCIQLLMASNGESPPLIFGIAKSYLKFVLGLAEEHNVSVDYRLVNPQTKSYLFNLVVEELDVDRVEKALEGDPSLVDVKDSKGRSLFTQAVLHGSKKEVIHLLLGKQTGSLAAEDEWIRKAFAGDSNFTKDAFLPLGDKFKQYVYRVANSYGHEKLVKKLSDLMGDREQILPSGPTIISPTMDILQAKEAVEGFFVKMRKNGLLLTKEEFNSYNQDDFICKGDDIGRFFGREHIIRVAKEQNLDRIKVPKKILVVETNGKPIKLYQSDRGQLRESTGNSTQVWAERVVPSPRPITQNEAEQLLTFLYHTRFNDAGRGNFIIAEDGIYVIDTEATNFTHPDPRLLWGTFQSILKNNDALELVRKKYNGWLGEEGKAKELDKKFDEANKKRKVHRRNLGFKYPASRKRWKFKLDKQKILSEKPILSGSDI